MKKLLTRTMLLLATALVLFTSCDNSETRVEDAVYASDITLSENSIEILAGDEDLTQLVATVKPENTTVEGVRWASRDTSVATVDEEGKVSGVGGGETTIVAYSADGAKVSNECTVTVKPCVTSLTLQVKDEQKNLVDVAGEVDTYKNINQKLIPTTVPALETCCMKDAEGNFVPVTIEWESSNPEVMTVDAEGNIEPLTKGEALITARSSDGKCYDVCTYTVDVVYATEAKTLQSTAEVNYGESLQLDGGLNPYYGENMKMWRSDKANIVVVENGLITGTGVGTTTVTFSWVPEGGNPATDAISQTCEVTVEAVDIEAIALPETAKVTVGGEPLTLAPTFTPANTSCNKLTWKSSNDAIATVDEETGVITGVSAGEVEITATATKVDETPLEATCKVTVGVNYVTDMTISSETATMILGGETMTLTAQVTAPEDASDKTVTWSIKTDDVAPVDVDDTTAPATPAIISYVESFDAETGVATVVVTAESAGTVTLVATANGAADNEPMFKECVITVENVFVTGLSLDPTTIILPFGTSATQTLKPTFEPANASDQTITWTSSDVTKVTVDANGVITVVATEASAEAVTITATANGIEAGKDAVTATCVVTIADVYVSNIAIDNTTTASYDENFGDVQLTATLTPTTVSNATVTWSVAPAVVGNSAVTIDAATGVMTIGAMSGEDAETYTVTATAEGSEDAANKKTAEYTFTVAKPDPATYTITMNGGGDAELKESLKALFPDYENKVYNRVVVKGTYSPDVFVTVDIACLAKNFKIVDLTDLVWPKSNAEGTKRAAFTGSQFANNKNLVEFYMPSNATNYGANLFQGCSSLKKYVGSKFANWSSNNMFDGCSSLKVVENTFDVIATFNQINFQNCTSLTGTITLDKVVKLGNAVFNGCSNIDAIVINTATPDTITAMTETTFPEEFKTGTGTKYIFVPSDKVDDFKKIQLVGGSNTVGDIFNVKAIAD